MLIKRSIACVFAFMSMVGLYAQNKQLLYNFSEIPQSLMLNPGGKQPGRAYIGVPLVSGLYGSASSSNISVYDAFEDGRFNLDPNKSKMEERLEYVIGRLDRNDTQRATQQIELFNAGLEIGGLFNKYFLSFGLYKETDFFNYWPEDLAYLGYYGNQTGTSRYNLADANLKGEVVTVLHVGLQHELNEKWTIGGRLKFYSSNMDVTSIDNKGFVGSGSESDQIFNADAVVHTSNNQRLKEIYRYIRDDIFDGDVDPISDAIALHRKVYAQGPFISKNIGVGIDLGFTYEPSENWSYSASILDLGFINHKEDVVNYVVTGTNGFEGTSNSGSDPEDLLQVIEGDFNRTYNAESYTTMRPVEFYASAMYRFGYFRSNKPCNCPTSKDLPSAIGLQLFAEKRPRNPEIALTAFYYRKIWEPLRIKATYTVDKYSKTNLGLGLSTHFANFNFYLLANNLLEYGNLADANTLTLQMGLNYVFPVKR